jgi:hypothetical protein
VLWVSRHGWKFKSHTTETQWRQLEQCRIRSLGRRAAQLQHRLEVFAPVLRELRARGLGYFCVAQELNRRGISPPRTTAWNRTTVRKYCRLLRI